MNNADFFFCLTRFPHIYHISSTLKLVSVKRINVVQTEVVYALTPGVYATKLEAVSLSQCLLKIIQ